MLLVKGRDVGLEQFETGAEFFMPRFPIGDLALSATVLGPTTTASFEGGGGCGGGGRGGVVIWHGLLLFTSRPILAVNGGLCWFCNFSKQILLRKPRVVVLATSGGWWCSRHDQEWMVASWLLRG